MTGCPGILSRVTESVKNIVPGWLQRYFNKSENACSCSADASEVPHWPENREDERVIYAGEDNTNIDDGRITPEPAGNNTEGSYLFDSASTSLPPLWSPEAERSHSLSQHTATSSKKPAFNLSAFGTLSTSLGNSSILKTSQLGDSPFYPGKTTYGGAAAAVRQSKVRNTPYQAPVRRQMKAKQLNAQSYGVTSSTARRILQSLEKMSSPLSVDSQYPPVQRLMTPKPVSIATNRTIYFKPSLTPSDYNGFSYPNFSIPAANGLSSGVGGGGGKMRRERTRFVTSKPPEEEIGFTFSVPVAKTELSGSNSSSEPILSSSAQDNTVVNSSSYKKRSATCEDPFTPAKILREGSVLDILKTPGFMSPKVDSPAVQPTTTSPVVYTRPAISTFSSSGIEFGESLKAGSSWQCDTCLLQNRVTDNKCIACQAAKLSPKETAKQAGIGTPSKSDKPASTSGTGFGDKFKPAVGTWDCDTCLVQNKPEAVKCVACETPKPGTGVKRVLTLAVASESPVTASSSSCTVTTGTLGFGDKFKRPVGSWECPVCCVCNKAEDNKCVSCMSEKPGSVSASSISPVSVSLSSGGCLGLDKFKKPEGSWDCEVCLVQNKADSTKCIACESAKPGTKSEFKGFGTSSSSLNPAPPAFKFGIPSASSGLSQTFTSTGNFKFGDQGGFKLGASSDSGSANSTNTNLKFSKPTGDFKFGVSSDSKPEEIKNDSKNDHFKFGLTSGLSNPGSSAPFQFGVSTLGQQEKKEELPKSSSAGFSFGAGVSNLPTAVNDTTVTSENKGGFNFGTIDTKSVSVTPFTYKTAEAKKDDSSATKGGFTFGKVESASSPSASMFVLGRTEEKQQEPVTSTSLVFGKKADNEEPKCQPVFSFGNSEQTKDESSSKPTFSFSVAKPSVKESEQLAKATFSFGNQTNTTTDQGVAKPVFSFLNSSSSSSSAPATSSGGGIFGSSTSSSNPPVAAFVFGQASNPVSSSAFGNSAETSTSQSLLFPQDSKPATTSSTGSAAPPFVFGPGAPSNSTASSGFNFGATTSSSSGSSFVFGTGHSAPSASPAFGANQTPTFGQSQGASQPNPPSFGSISSSTALFSAGSQPAPPPTFGTVSSSSQPPVFGQQASQSAFGSGTAPNS
ncbi:hypothetical protein A6R68_04749, partial [Neotoma lepida]